MRKRMSEQMQVAESAIEFWNTFYFSFPDETEREAVAISCSGLTRREIEDRLFESRKHNLKINKFKNSNEFVELYTVNKKCALEKMFQQPFNEKMLSLFNGCPAHLYEIHSKWPKSWFMECLLYV